MFYKPGEIVEQYISSGVSKSKLSIEQLIGKSILAGAMIAMGASCSSVAAHSINNVGIARLVAGCVFPVGLMMVIVLGAELFTGDCLLSLPLADRKLSIFQFLRILVCVYLGNFLGGIILAILVFFSGQFNYSGGQLGAYTIKVALAKVQMTPVQAISSGILCNILVCAAVLIAISAKDITGKLLTSFFVIMPFVTGGFEHCVANMYYIPAGLLAKTNYHYIEVLSSVYGISDISDLSVVGFLVNNLLPVTIGNIIGGSVCVGLAMYYLNTTRKRRKENDISLDCISSAGN